MANGINRGFLNSQIEDVIDSYIARTEFIFIARLHFGI